MENIYFRCVETCKRPQENIIKATFEIVGQENICFIINSTDFPKDFLSKEILIDEFYEFYDQKQKEYKDSFSNILMNSINKCKKSCGK